MHPEKDRHTNQFNGDVQALFPAVRVPRSAPGSGRSDQGRNRMRGSMPGEKAVRMQSDDDARLDTSEVQDVRGSRLPGGRATMGGGRVGVSALVLGLLVGTDQF